MRTLFVSHKLAPTLGAAYCIPASRRGYNANGDVLERFCCPYRDENSHEQPCAGFLIVGRSFFRPPATTLREQDLVTGSVPSTSPFLEGATVMVVPRLFVSGTRIKLLKT
jgi:hypothetical protein